MDCELPKVWLVSSHLVSCETMRTPSPHIAHGNDPLNDLKNKKTLVELGVSESHEFQYHRRIFRQAVRSKKHTNAPRRATCANEHDIDSDGVALMVTNR